MLQTRCEYPQAEPANNVLSALRHAQHAVLKTHDYTHVSLSSAPASDSLKHKIDA